MKILCFQNTSEHGLYPQFLSLQMRKNILCFLCFVFSFLVYGQKTPIKTSSKVSDSNNLISKKNTKPKDLKASIEKYLIINYKNDTTYVDTTLTIQKEYKYNYLRKDNFNLMQFANTGQTYNTLSLNASSNKIKPSFSAQARHYNYMEIEDVNYYNVPTPLTDLYFKTVFSQGQNLDAFFTVNTSKEFNFSIAYKGMRSLIASPRVPFNFCSLRLSNSTLHGVNFQRLR